MCIIYTDTVTNTCKIFIHIPRTGGKAWRRLLRADPNVRVQKELWGTSAGYDRAHVPAKHLCRHVGDPGVYELYALYATHASD